jgi:hypothetical protein
MKAKNLLHVIIFFLFAQLFISCQKNNELSGNNVNANSVDNSINTLPVDSSLVAWYRFTMVSLLIKVLWEQIVFCSATPLHQDQGRIVVPII